MILLFGLFLLTRKYEEDIGILLGYGGPAPKRISRKEKRLLARPGWQRGTWRVKIYSVVLEMLEIGFKLKNWPYLALYGP